MKKIFYFILAVLLLIVSAGCAPEDVFDDMAGDALEFILDEDIKNDDNDGGPADRSFAPAEAPHDDETPIDEDGWYYDKDSVALYIHTYGKLPGNYMTKKEAEELGWEGGSLEPFAKGKAIGGSRFGNYEGSLPEKKGRKYTECDIDTKGKKSRGAKRIIFSNDGLIYYTGDHYETFELLYGEE